MKRIPFTYFLGATLVFSLAPLCGSAVSVSTPVLPQNAFAIEIKEPAQGFYCQDARKITHISLQKYITAQATETSRGTTQMQYVTEVSIDFADSPLQVRIYAQEEFDPLRIAQKISAYNATRSRAKKAVNTLTKSNATGIIEYLPAKTYPASTHAKTIEFRVPDFEEVEEFYNLIMIYYLRSREDRQYFGAISAPACKVIDQSFFLGIKKPSPACNWNSALENKKVVAGSSKIIVSGLSGLLFTLGTPDTIATEIERQDVNKN